jgi:hypothetical protein
MKWCACKAREATERVVFRTADHQVVTARFCRPCWDQWREKNPVTVKSITTSPLATDAGKDGNG